MASDDGGEQRAVSNLSPASIADLVHNVRDATQAHGYCPTPAALAAASALEALAREREARDEDVPCAQALNDLWLAIILKHKPDYGDWEYPGQAYRHLLAEFTELRAERDALRARADQLTTSYERYIGVVESQIPRISALESENRQLRERLDGLERPLTDADRSLG